MLETFIVIGASFIIAIVLFIDQRQISELKKQSENQKVGKDWKTEYSEASEDRRQYSNLTWQIPSASV
jgi:hypothetical protein